MQLWSYPDLVPEPIPNQSRTNPEPILNLVLLCKNKCTPLPGNLKAHGSPSVDNREAREVQRRSPGITKEKPKFNNRSPCFTIHFDINNRWINRGLFPVPNSGLVLGPILSCILGSLLSCILGSLVWLQRWCLDWKVLWSDLNIFRSDKDPTQISPLETTQNATKNWSQNQSRTNPEFGTIVYILKSMHTLPW